MKPRLGKIARLPLAIRTQINHHLADNHLGTKIVKWLNSLPEVRQICADLFAGRPVTVQNLSEWRAGGYQDWLTRREYLQYAGEIASDAQHCRAASESPDSDHQLADHLATILSARYAKLLYNWNGEFSEDFQRQLRLLRAMTQDIASLRREDHRLSRLHLARQRLNETRQKSQAELVDLFKAWNRIPEIQVIQNRRLTPEQKSTEYDRVFGVPQASPPVSAGNVPVPAPRSRKRRNRARNASRRPRSSKSNKSHRRHPANLQPSTCNQQRINANPAQSDPIKPSTIPSQLSAADYQAWLKDPTDRSIRPSKLTPKESFLRFCQILDIKPENHRDYKIYFPDGPDPECESAAGVSQASSPASSGDVPVAVQAVPPDTGLDITISTDHPTTPIG